MRNFADMEAKSFLQSVITLYGQNARDERFNGVRLEQLRLPLADEEIRSLIVELVTGRKLDCLGPASLNPHIKRLAPPKVEAQIKMLDVAEKYHTCLYPAPEVIRASIDLSLFNSKPFTKQLAEAAPQVEALFFEVQALDRYRRDPRYLFSFNGYAGRMSISVPADSYESIPERDRVFLENFGLGLEANGYPVVAVYRRYLASLSAEHQQYWNSFEFHGDAKIHENFYKPTILGEWYTNNSALAAIAHIIREINRISCLVWGRALFRLEFPENPHYNLTPFIKPIMADFLSFAHELDKIVGENLDKRTLELMLAEEDIKLEKGDLGTITMLEEFLFSNHMKWENEAEAREVIIGSMRKLRRLRQKPAHTIVRDTYEISLYGERRVLLGNIVFGLGSILQLLRKHHRAPEVELPAWLEKGEVEIL